MIDTGFAAGGLDPDRNIGAQDVGPGKLACPLVELGQMDGRKTAEPDQNLVGAAQLQIRAPHLGPAAANRYAARHHLRIGKAAGGDLVAQGVFKPRGRYQENLKIGICHPSLLHRIVQWRDRQIGLIKCG